MSNIAKRSWREASKVDYTPREGESISAENINSGSFQRMADSLEMIAKDKTRLEKDAQYWKESSKKKDEEIILLTNRIRGLRSRITTLLANISRLGGKA
jgi:hypothetical protein